jgi:hypothetical protein
MARLSNAICCIPGCSSAVWVKSRGWCSKHYQRWQTHGDPTKSTIDRAQTGRGCSVPGCEKTAGYKGMCQAHYKRARIYGSPEIFSPVYRRREKWLREHVSYQGAECLPWPFAVGDHGRGNAVLDGRLMSAPKAMCILAHGEPPSPDHETAHSCGMGHLGCINPRHLSWKTHRENEADKLAHGTIVRGEAVNTAKLSEEAVRDIRRLKGRESRACLADRYGVTVGTIHDVQVRRTWAWLE